MAESLAFISQLQYKNEETYGQLFIFVLKNKREVSNHEVLDE